MDRALTGIRVVDLGIITAGANTSQILGDLGAEVIKVEAASAPDPFRTWPQAMYNGSGPARDPWNLSPMFNMLNRNKRGICLDLKSPLGREAFLRLVGVSDVVIENFRRGVMEGLGLGYAQLAAANPRMVMVSITSQGSDGPEARFGSYGSTLDALSGLMSLTGYPDSHPIWSSETVNYPDQVASLFAAGLTMAAVRLRDRTGKGRAVDLSQRELITTMIGEYVAQYSLGAELPSPTGNQRPEQAPNDCYRCQGEDAWVAITVDTDAEWRQLCQLIGRADLVTSPLAATREARQSNLDAIRQAIEQWTSGLPKRQAMQELVAAGVKAGEVKTGADLLEDPHLASRGYYQTLTNHSSGRQTLRVAPYRLSLTPATVERPAPMLGQDTESVLADIVGLTPDELMRLEAQGVTNNLPAGSSLAEGESDPDQFRCVRQVTP